MRRQTAQTPSSRSSTAPAVRWRWHLPVLLRGGLRGVDAHSTFHAGSRAAQFAGANAEAVYRQTDAFKSDDYVEAFVQAYEMLDSKMRERA